MLTATILSLAIPLALPQTWPTILPPAIAIEEGKLGDLSYILGTVIPLRNSAIRSEVLSGEAISVIIGPTELLADRFAFARNTAAELMGYFDLEDNWDGEGAAAPDPEAVNDAFRILEVVPIDVGAPKAMVLATGEIALYWDFGDVYAEIGFDGSGRYYAYARRPDAEPVHLDDVTLADDTGRCIFPPPVLEVLTWEPTKITA